MKLNMDYKILKDSIPIGLEIKVRDYMKKGWTPTGGVVIDAVFGYMRALVKYPKNSIR
jgi:hypothetical protein